MSKEETAVNFEGMTLNERLQAAGLLPRFDGALGNRDRDKLISLLIKVGVHKRDARWTADKLLKDLR